MAYNQARRRAQVRRLLSGAAVAALAGAASPGVAAAQAPANEPVVLEDIVVTAQRREQSLSDVPVSVQAVGGLALERQAVTDTASLTQVAPSLTFIGSFSANASGFLIRGITSQASEGGIQQSTAMIVDGVPLARPGEFLSDLGDVERIEVLRGPQGTLFGKNATAGVVSIVTRRPGGTFEGSLEAGATTDSEYLLRAMLNAPLGEAVRTRVTGYYKHLEPLIENEGPAPDVYGAESYGAVAKLDADLAPGVELRLTADYRRAESTFGQGINIIPSTGIGAAQVAVLGFTPRPGLNRVATNGANIEKTRAHGVAAELSWASADGLRLTSITAYRHFEDDNVNDVDGTPVGVQQGIGFAPNPTGYPIQAVTANLPRQPQDVSYVSQELRLNYERGRVSAVGGLFYQTLVDKGSGSVPFLFDGAFILQNPALAGVLFYTDTKLRYRINNDSWAAFGDVTLAVTDTISVFGGLRFTHESVTDDYSNATYFNPAAGAFNPVTLANSAPPVSTVAFNITRTIDNLSGRLGVQWQPDADQNYYASYNTGYKGPAADVSRAATRPDPATGYSPVLAPEKAESFELGSKQRLLGDRLQVNLNLYWQKIRNQQQQVVLPTTVTQLINAGGVRSQGVELDFRARLAPSLTLDGGLALNDAEYTGNVFVTAYPGQTAAEGRLPNGTYDIKGLRARGAYKVRYNLGVTYEPELPDLPFDLVARVGWNWFDDTQTNVGKDPLLVEPSYGLLDASVTLTSRDELWRLQVYGKNLTDRRYYNFRAGVDNLISRVSGNVNRDYRRYGGVVLTRRF